MTDTIDHPLRLAIGSHQAGSGKGCAMNVISWENGDTKITDLPACADPFLAKVVQRVNDSICTHHDGDLLCPTCSVKMLDLAHRTVGTGTHLMSEADRRRVWTTIARTEADSVAHLRTYAATAVYADDVDAVYAAYAAATYANNAAYDAAAAAYAAATYANGVAYDAAAAYANAVYAPTDDVRLTRAHRVIDQWCELAEFTPQPVAPEVTACAIDSMIAMSA